MVAGERDLGAKIVEALSRRPSREPKEWRIPAAEHREFYLTLGHTGMLTLQAHDPDKSTSKDKTVLTFKNIGNVALRLAVHPAKEAQMETESNELLGETFALYDDDSPEGRKRQEEIHNRLWEMEKEAPTSGKQIGVVYQGLVSWVIRLLVFSGSSRSRGYAVAWIFPKSEFEGKRAPPLPEAEGQ
jgi:hypothetical protein